MILFNQMSFFFSSGIEYIAALVDWLGEDGGRYYEMGITYGYTDPSHYSNFFKLGSELGGDQKVIYRTKSIETIARNIAQEKV